MISTRSNIASRSNRTHDLDFGKRFLDIFKPFPEWIERERERDFIIDIGSQRRPMGPIVNHLHKVTLSQEREIGTNYKSLLMEEGYR